MTNTENWLDETLEEPPFWKGEPVPYVQAALEADRSITWVRNQATTHCSRYPKCANGRIGIERDLLDEAIRKDKLGRERVKRPEPIVQPAAFTVNGLCAYFSISRSTVYRMISSGDLKPITVGGRTLFRRVDLDALLARLYAEQNPSP